MANASIWLKKIDREQDFLANKPMRVKGTDFLPGQPFEKSLVSTRRLRQLYESRKVKMVAPGQREAQDPRDAIVIPEDWASKAFLAMRSIAKQISPGLDAKAKKPGIVAVIEAEIARREAAMGDATRNDKPEPSEPAETDIPDDWREIEVDTRIALAVKLTGEAIGTDEDAVAAIELEIERRKAEADGQSA